MHESVKDRGAHRVVALICAPILRNAIGCHDNAAMYCSVDGLAFAVARRRHRTRQEQVIQHEEIALEDGSQSGIALSRWAQRETVKEVVGLQICTLWPSRTAR